MCVSTTRINSKSVHNECALRPETVFVSTNYDIRYDIFQAATDKAPMDVVSYMLGSLGVQ